MDKHFRELRKHRRLSTLSPYRYGQKIAYENIEELRAFMKDHGFNMTDDEIISYCQKHMSQLFRKIALCIDHRVEVLWKAGIHRKQKHLFHIKYAYKNDRKD